MNERMNSTPSTQTLTFAANLMMELSSKHLLKHPFYKQWSDGTLCKDKLKTYARQYYHHVSAFPRYLSATHSNCESITARQVLLDNLIDEEKGESNHPELWLRFAEGVGATREAVQTEELLPETRKLIDTFMSSSRSSYAEGLGALFAYEHQVPEIAQFKSDALEKHYDVPANGSGAEFFRVHAQADVYHTQAVSELLNQLSPEDKELAMKAAFEASTQLWEFLDGMHATGVAVAS